MPQGILGLPRLTNIRPFSRTLPDTFYRAEHESNTREVEQFGFRPQEASECPSNRGVHVFTTPEAAEQWAQGIQGDARVWKIEGLDKDKLTKDYYYYLPLPKAYVYCTTTGISQDKITDTGEVL